MTRQIIRIDEEICDGCGECVPNCPEGALRIVDGKARLVGDLLCDGLGACIGNCPRGAIEVETRDAEPYDEEQVMRSMIPQGAPVVIAHLQHLLDHGEDGFFRRAVAVLHGTSFEGKADVQAFLMRSRSGAAAAGPAAHADSPAAAVPARAEAAPSSAPGPVFSGCPGSMARHFEAANGGGRTAEAASKAKEPADADVPSELTQWPVQMHLMNPAASHFRGSDFVLAADCTAFALGGFHGRILAGKKLGIACPKLDQGLDVYREKIRVLIDEAQIDTLTVAVMEVPCCGGLLRIAKEAAAEAKRKVPIRRIVVGVEGEVLSQDWI